MSGKRRKEYTEGELERFGKASKHGLDRMADTGIRRSMEAKGNVPVLTYRRQSSQYYIEDPDLVRLC